MEDAAFLDVPTRLAKRLLELMGTRPAADGWVALKSRLSQRELGELIGATRESVNKHLRLLEENGLIARKGSQIVVAADRLRAYIDRSR